MIAAMWVNYIAEKSGFDYAEGNFANNASKEIIEKFNHEKSKIVLDLISDLVGQIRKETKISVRNLMAALKDRILIYNGGGSTHSFLTEPISYFTDVKLIDANMWKEENIKDKSKVESLCQLLTTAYGLSIGESDEDVKLCEFSNLFSEFPRKEGAR